MKERSALEDLLGADQVADIARLLQPAAPGFDAESFVARGTEGREAVLAPGESLAFERRIRLADMSTRRHHPGEHLVELLVNGRSLGRVPFELEQ